MYKKFVFLPSGSVDLDSVEDPVTRHMYEIQILEFGQIPRQLFNKPHPRRFGGFIPTPLPLAGVAANVDTAKPQGRFTDLQLDAVFQGHKKSVTGVTFTNNDASAVSVSLDGFLKVYK